MKQSVAAIACYIPLRIGTTNFTYYADPTKLKDYLSVGLPIILTDLSYNAKEIHQKRCGIIVKYDKNEIANAIIQLLGNREMLNEYSRNSIRYIKEFTWERIFRKALYEYEHTRAIR